MTEPEPEQMTPYALDDALEPLREKFEETKTYLDDLAAGRPVDEDRSFGGRMHSLTLINTSIIIALLEERQATIEAINTGMAEFGNDDA